MAYMTKDGRGPYPNKAGEYCGNHFPDGHIPHMFGVDRAEEAKAHASWLARMRFGRPHHCEAGTPEQMEAMGYVGLYMKADSSPLSDDSVEVPTPDELKEPWPWKSNPPQNQTLAPVEEKR